MIRAKIQLDSINIFGNRIVSPMLQFPRIVLAEFNTHKMISKNSASSRAIPFAKMLEKIQKNPFIPIAWMKDHSGMQGTEYFTNEEEIQGNLEEWMQARNFAITQAKILSERGVTKQIVNRLIEPFMWHRVLATATEWENFFALRAAEGAEIHIRELAHVLLKEFNESTPKLVKEGEWHLPFGDNIDEGLLHELLFKNGIGKPYETLIDYKLKIATARSARTSYDNFDGTSNYLKDIDMHDNKLVQPGHWSPMEHPNRSMYESEFFNFTKSIVIPTSEVEYYESVNNDDWYEIVAVQGDDTVITEFGWCRNMRGWIPYRHFFQNENRRDPRLVKK